MCTLLATDDLVKYSIHFLKPKFQKLLGMYKLGPACTQYSDGPGQNPVIGYQNILCPDSKLIL